jgi:hypothetical protein
MRKFNITIILLIISINFFGQTALKENEIIGKWKVIDTKITIKGAESNENFKILKKGFINTIFYFKGNGIFNIKFKNNAPAFFKELETMNNVNWIYVSQNNSIRIGTKKDKYTEMEIFPEKRKNSFFFNITGLILEMEKVLAEEKTSFVEIEGKKEEKVETGKVVLKKENIENSEILQYEKVEITPTFSKCKSKNEEKKKKCFKKELYQHFGKKFNSTLPSELGLVAGVHKIENSFTINKNGEIVNIESTGTNEKLNNECKRVISLLPKMKPGINKGKIINVKYEIPFTIRVE